MVFHSLASCLANTAEVCRQGALLGNDLLSGLNAHLHVRDQGVVLCCANLCFAHHKPLAASPGLVSLAQESQSSCTVEVKINQPLGSVLIHRDTQSSSKSSLKWVLLSLSRFSPSSLTNRKRSACPKPRLQMLQDATGQSHGGSWLENPQTR